MPGCHILFGQASYAQFAFHWLGFVSKRKVQQQKWIRACKKAKSSQAGEKQKKLNLSLGEKLLEMRENFLGKMQQDGVEPRLGEFLFRNEIQ